MNRNGISTQEKKGFSIVILNLKSYYYAMVLVQKRNRNEKR